MKPTLWTKDFTLITTGTVISAIASQVINLPLSLLVFDKTGSTLLSALIFIVSMLPSVAIPMIVAPIIDNSPKKKYIVGLDYLIAVLYIVVAWIFKSHGFNYALVIAVSFVFGSIGSVYQIAYRAWYPDLISKGFEQKAYAISSTIYPTVTIIFAPLAAWLYESIAVYQIFLIVSLALFVTASIELLIREQFVVSDKQKFDWQAYKQDFIAGLNFIKRERGIRNIYTYMGIANGVSLSVTLMTQAFFQTSVVLTTTMLGLLKSAETIGRLIGGIFQYKVDIAPKKRYGITKLVYFIYDGMDMILLFLPYPLMLVNRFICGALGMTSATIREAAVQSYLPRTMRAKVNAVFTAYFSLSVIIFQLIAGYLGDILGFRSVAVIIACVGILAIYLLIVLPGNTNRQVYEATRE